MTDSNGPPFLQFLEIGVAKGGFETDDILAALLPLMKQVVAAHEAGLVAPLDGLRDVRVTDAGHLMFAPAKVNSPKKVTAKVETLQVPVSEAVEVIGESRRTADIDEGSLTVFDLGVGAVARHLGLAVPSGALAFGVLLLQARVVTRNRGMRRLGEPGETLASLLTEGSEVRDGDRTTDL